MRSDPAMADVPDAEKLDLVLSDAFRPILTFHAQSRARGGAQVVELQNRLQRNQDAQGAAPAPHLPRAASGY
ncbi:MAG TPA: hypothetical protein VEB20_26520 [Azospirillaceae bacterium]|nr:hypothetical protein [Azospirillaceae bacterium]